MGLQIGLRKGILRRMSAFWRDINPCERSLFSDFAAVPIFQRIWRQMPSQITASRAGRFRR